MKVFWRLLRFLEGWSSIPKVLKIASLQCPYNVSKKNLEIKFILCMQINIKISLQADFNTLDIKASCKAMLSLLKGIIKHSQSAHNNQFEIFLQNLKKVVNDGVHFLHADKHLSFYKLLLPFLMAWKLAFIRTLFFKKF